MSQASESALRGGMSQDDLDRHIATWKQRDRPVVSHEEFMLVVKDIDFNEDTIVAWRDLLAEHGVTLDEQVDELDQREVLRTVAQEAAAVTDTHAEAEVIEDELLPSRRVRAALLDRDASRSIGSTSDPVRMYLKEIGKVPLLTGPRGGRRSPSASRPGCIAAERLAELDAAASSTARRRRAPPARAPSPRRRAGQERAHPGQPAPRRVDRQALRRPRACCSSTSSRRATSA